MAACTQNRDPLKLLRDGTSQTERFPAALDPAHAPINAHLPEHGIVFAQEYASYLNYYDAQNPTIPSGDWTPFFRADVAAQLALVAVQDVAYYRQQVRESLNFLTNRDNRNEPEALRDHLDYLFSCVASLAIGFNQLAEQLPPEIALKASLQNRIRGQLAPALKRLIRYHKDGESIVFDGEKLLNTAVDEVPAPFKIFGRPAMKFSQLAMVNLSQEWIRDATDNFTNDNNNTGEDSSVYGTPKEPSVFAYVEHIATHNLFTSILEQFLKVYARVVHDAQAQLGDTFTKWDHHEPHYALFLAFLRLFEHARTEANTLTGRHLDFYYRKILQLKEKAAAPGQAHLLVELAKQVPAHQIQTGTRFKAGKDDSGKDAFFANDHDVVINQATVTELKTLYRHDEEPSAETQTGDNPVRFYASPVANSDDGAGAELTSVDQSWHPFHNKVYRDGQFQSVNMPQAEIGFAIASHYLLMAEGARTITVTTVPPVPPGTNNVPDWSTASDRGDAVRCFLTGEKGWLETSTTCFTADKSGHLQLQLTLDGTEPAITPYVATVHGYTFETNLPLLLVKLQHHTDAPSSYPQLQATEVSTIELTVAVAGLRSLAVSNDFGPVDTSKPFQPYGASPVANSAWVIGSKEVFQKQLTCACIKACWLTKPTPYCGAPKPADKTDDAQNKVIESVKARLQTAQTGDQEDEAKGPVQVKIDFLEAGKWEDSNIPLLDVTSKCDELSGDLDKPVVDELNGDLDKPVVYELSGALDKPVVDEPDFGPNGFYQTGSRHGFVRLRLTRDFGQQTYQTDLIKFLRGKIQAIGEPPVAPLIRELSMDYCATQTIDLTSADADKFQTRQARFFHLAPFGQAEQHRKLLGSTTPFLLPQFSSLNGQRESEFYIGITGLKPPQSLALLFQVVDGSADPRMKTPEYIHWSYLGNNRWHEFKPSEVADRTGGLLNSGIITFSVPRAATDTNTLLPSNMHWIRAAVASHSDAVCRLVKVAAQAVETTFVDQENDPAFPAKVLAAGTITKLAQPEAAVKKIVQPFPTFGGRGAESENAFYTRVSERLRHKDRAIALWDYERLILEAFPQIYKVRCLNHTKYKPAENDSAAIYKELAPGHVTIVTIPNQQAQHQRDPLQPFTSLGLLKDIEEFLRKRLSAFVTLHVRNPQFEPVRVACKVQLHAGFDDSFYRTKLQEAITRFLSPWAFSADAHPSFRGTIYKSVLINFVEEQPYVDYVTDFELFHTYERSDGESNSQTKTDEDNAVSGSKAISILVSAPATEHTIEILSH